MRMFPLVAALSLVAGCSCNQTDEGDDTGVTGDEIPYDGIDQDGDGEDLLDVDGDGYPGIGPDDYDGAWPEGMPTEVDCNDEDDTIHPNSNFEVWYDGVDGDCDGADDYDYDGDGYVPDQDPSTGQPFDPPYDGDLPGGDCDDVDADVNPGVAVSDDDPYDGVDANCDCANDFDVDGDTYSPNEAVNGSAFDTFNVRYGCDLTAAWGDCDDNDAGVNPGATETWYDGEDTDCDGADDYDQDGDGYAPDEYASDSALPGGDCDDLDPTVGPGANEIFGDAFDQDCDGNDDFGALDPVQPADWVNPRTPHVIRVDDQVIGVFSAEQWTDRSTVPAITRDWPGMFAVLESGQAEFVDSYFWNGAATSDPLSGGFDAASDDDGNLYIAYGMQRVVSTGSNMYLSLRGYSWTGTSWSALAPILQALNSETFPIDIDVQVGGDEIYAGSCADGYLQYAHATWASGSFSRSSVGSNDASGGTACVLDLTAGTAETEVLLHVQGPASDDPKPYVLRDGADALVDDDPGDTQAGPYEDMELLLVNEDEGMVSVYDGVSGNTYLIGDFGTETLFVATEVYEISASRDSSKGDVYVAAVTEDGDNDGIADLVVLYGQPGALTEVQVDLDGATPFGAGIEVTADDLTLVVSTRDPYSDAGDIRWTFLELP